MSEPGHSPWIRRCPHRGLSLARRTTTAERVPQRFNPVQTSVLVLSGTGADPGPLSGLVPGYYRPGRGFLSTPSCRQVIQVAC